MTTRFLGLCFIGIILINCDARTRKTDSLKHAIEAFKTTNQAPEEIEVFPETYTETSVDSLIFDTFKVKIKNFSLMDHKDIIELKNPKDSQIKLYRKFQSDIRIEYQSELLASFAINADTFPLRNQDPFWDMATLEHAWVDLESSNSAEVHIQISFLNPATKAHKLFAMHVNHEGLDRVKFIEDYTL